MCKMMNGRSENSPTTTTLAVKVNTAESKSAQTQETGQKQAAVAPMPPQYVNQPSQVVPQRMFQPQQAHYHPWGSAVEPSMALAGYESRTAMDGSSFAPVMRSHSNVAHPHNQIHIANQINIANNNPFAMLQEPRQNNVMQHIAFNGMPAPADVPAGQLSALDDEIATLQEQLNILNRLRVLRERRRNLDM